MILGNHVNDPAKVCTAPGKQILRDWDAGVRDSLVAKRIMNGAIQYDWARFDAYVAACEKVGSKLLHTFGSTPAWATMPGVANAPNSIWGRTENLPWVPELEDDYTTAVATRYKGRIHAYEDGNEVNYTGFDAATLTQQFDRLQRRYKIIKAIDPCALVLMPSVTWSWPGNCVQTALDAMFKLGFHDFADAIAFHGYIPTGLADIRSTIGGIWTLTTKYEVCLPLWDTEVIGADVNKIPLNCQRAWVLGAAADHELEGVAVMIAYQADNATHGGQFNVDRSLNPIGEGWRDAAMLFGTGND